MKRVLFITLTALVIVVLLIAAGPSLVVKHDINNGYRISLKPPSFIQPAYAQKNPEAFEIGEKLDAEAGISAYFQSPVAINLTNAKTAFRTIELETADYLIGSVPVPNHPEIFDVHVYVHSDGWILAYYDNTNPASKMVDVYARTINTTKFTTVIATVASASGVPFTGETYYDFRYPNATNLLLVAEDGENGDDFYITLPTSYGYFERGLAFGGKWGANYCIQVDGVEHTPIWADDNMGYGILTASQLAPGSSHHIDISCQYGEYAVLTITYWVP